jgi:hypothetical protein
MEMFTRDISLEACILDLIDNSIDALVRTKGIDISTDIFNSTTKNTSLEPDRLARIDVSFSENEFNIVDNCGGISQKDAMTDVFNFGHQSDQVNGLLGAYGIGLKRAIFKIGNDFEIESKTKAGGFKTSINVPQWSKKDRTVNDWKIPLSFIGGARTNSQAGTKITIKDLRPEVVMRLSESTLEVTLRNAIAQTYSLFLDKYVKLTLNGVGVTGEVLTMGESNEVQSGKDEFENDGVKVTLFAGLASRSPRREWQGDKAGWYILCNGRVVVSADKTELTGWGAGVLPQFHTKYRGFIGLAFFQSANPLLLPWTTTKRGLNRESQVYQIARNRMSGVARPIISFLNNMYPTELPEERREREMAEGLQNVDVRQLALKSKRAFTAETAKNYTPKSTVRVQFQAELDDLNRIKKRLRRPNLSNNQLAKHTFEYYLKTECPE